MNNIDTLLEKYWAGETTVSEEDRLKEYFRSDQVSDEHSSYRELFNYFDEQSMQTMGELDLDFVNKGSRSRTVRMWTRALAVAASLALLLTVSIQLFEKDQTEYKYKYTELQDPEEALAITKEALAFLSANYEKGMEPATRHFKQWEKTAVFE